MSADHTELRGLADQSFQRYDELTYRVHLPEHASGIEIAAPPDGPILSPTFASSQSATAIFSRIPVTTLDFTRQKASGEPVSALTGEGTMTFPDYPHLGTVPIKRNEAMGLERLDRFTITEISLTVHASGMHLVGDGTAAQVIEGASQVDVKFFTKTGQFFRGKRLRLKGGESSGLAALMVEGDLPSAIRALALNRDMAVPAGDSVAIIGVPQKAGVPWAVTMSEVIAEGKAIVFSEAVDEGHSGGPPIKNGAIIGVVTETTPP